MSAPVALTHAGDERLFVVERAGVVRIIENGSLVTEPFLDISELVSTSPGERGLLGLAFSPDYSDSGRFYVYYTNTSGHGVLARFSVSADDPNSANPGSRDELITLEDDEEWHLGGQLAFGPDRYLYWAVGDGGSGQNAQTLANLRGKLMRLDVSTASGYAPAPGNPFLETPGARDEIWAYGLRNPWRFSFDAQTGELYIADVGQDSFEEVNVAPAGVGGQNYGWPVMEGPECYLASNCDESPYTAPTFSYPRPDDGRASITGGYVYRGPAAPDLLGHYVFADFQMRSLSTARADEDWLIRPLETDSIRSASLGVDSDRRLYVTDFENGVVYEITQEEAEPSGR